MSNKQYVINKSLIEFFMKISIYNLVYLSCSVEPWVSFCVMTGLCVLRAGNQRFSQHRRSHVWLFTFLIVQNHGCLLGRFTVLANSEQNSRLANFLPESCLPLVQISSIFRKNGRENLNRNWFQRWRWRNGTLIQFSAEHSVRINRTTFSNVPLLLQIFRWNDRKSRFPYTFFCKWQTINVSEVACAVGEEKNELKWRLSLL